MEARLERQKTLLLTTRGRRSGLPRTARIWFVTDGERIYVQAGPKGQKGWYANLRAHPEVRIRVGSLEFSGRATPVLEEEERKRVLDLFRKKYLLARLGRWLGLRFGQGKPVRIEIDRESDPQGRTI